MMERWGRRDRNEEMEGNGIDGDDWSLGGSNKTLFGAIGMEGWMDGWNDREMGDVGMER